MIEWSKINSKTFEDLAFDYISYNYADLNWEKTKATRDGNKDGKCDYLAPLDVTLKYWFEAKYSKSTNKSIPKSHLDSTLVSCLLDGKVVVLAFITNAYISEDYKRRADIFSKQQNNLKIIYVNGEELEEWLYNNPKYELKYFSTNCAKRQDLNDKIKTSCFLQHYDMVGNNFITTTTLELGKKYVLYISFYSTNTKKAYLKSLNSTVELLHKDNRIYDDFLEISISKGYNSFYFPVAIVESNDSDLQFELINETEIYQFTISSIKVLDIYNPKVHYASQIDIQAKLFSLINDRDFSNGIFYIQGPAGSGKSYLINDMYENSKNPFNTFVISFTGNKDTDLINCYKIIILSLYGDIWNYSENSEVIFQFDDVESLMIQQILENKISLDISSQILLHYDNESSYIERQSIQTQILIDDFQKLNNDTAKLINGYFNWFIQQRFNCKLFIFSRPENDLLNVYTKKFEIKNIEKSDVVTSIKSNFKECIDANYLRDFPTPLNVLQLINILCRIHDQEANINKKTELEKQIILNDIYYDSVSNTCASFGNQIIYKYKHNPIVYCVYKIQSGLQIDAIFRFFNKDSYDMVYQLCQNRIIKELSNVLYPYHDILIASFKEIKSKEMDEILENFVVFAEKEQYISKTEMFAVLISIGKKCFWKYKSEAEEYCNELHSNADYAQALRITKELKNSNRKEYSEYSPRECRIQFIYANCLKYTESYQSANEEFERLCDLYQRTTIDEIRDISLESKTEIVNNCIWMLETKKAQKLINELSEVFNNLYKNKQIQGHSLIYAFLNFYNRKMFLNYMLDKGSINDYNDAIKFSKEFCKTEYIAFAKMDYAKCLYFSNFDKALILMNEAQSLLKTTNEKRRTLDVASEVWFLECIKKKELDYLEYNKIKNMMQQNHYVQSFTKIQLKLICLELLFKTESIEHIKNELKFLSVNNTSIKSGRRHQAYIYHLYAALYYADNNLKKSRFFSQNSLQLMEQMGKTYKSIHRNNIKLTKFNGFITIDKVSQDLQSDSFILDTRLW